jgi:hypothetical protein
VSEPFPSPTVPADSRTEVFLRYLDYFRSRVTAKIQAMPDAELRSSRLPSGWTPLELVKHLRYVELRWLEWGFEGRDVGDPCYSAFSGTHWFRHSPRPSIHVRSRLPGRRYTGGLRASPTPPQVPVAIRSPGRRVIAWLA